MHDIGIQFVNNPNIIFHFLENKNELEKAFKKNLILSIVSDGTLTDIKIT